MSPDKKDDCLQKHTGSCGGCNILEMIRNAAKKEGFEPVTRRISAQYCPTNAKPQTDLIKPAGQSRWGEVKYNW